MSDRVERAYRALFAWLPAEFRTRFANEMLEFFRARRAAAQARGVHARVTFTILAFADLLSTIQRERRRQHGPGGRLMVTRLRDDARAATRRLRRAPGLTLTVVGLLALTIGSATVVFSVVNAALLRPLPFGRPDRIMLVWETRANNRENFVGAHEFPVWARQNTSFSDMAAMIYNPGVHLTGAGEPKALLGVRVSESFFRVMGVQPAVGRAFSADEDQEGRGQVAVISDRLWRERFAVAAVGRDILLDGKLHRVIGVMPAGFAFPPSSPGVTPDVWDADRREHRTAAGTASPLRRRPTERRHVTRSGADRHVARR